MVTRCICHNVPFAEVRARFERGETLDAIIAQTRCCTGCSLCSPYVRLVLRTGRIALPVLTAQQAEGVMREPVALPPARPDAAPGGKGGPGVPGAVSWPPSDR